jgi:mono/diheme cytochrome c family protein
VKTLAPLLSAAAVLAAASLALLETAQAADAVIDKDTVIGREEYLMHCAACHGPEGRGDGPIGQMLKTPAPNLALIAQRNGGTYPVQKVYEIIDGSSVVAAHGSRDMPLWGDRYRHDPKPQTPDQASAASDLAQQRILSLVYYLGTLQ